MVLVGFLELAGVDPSGLEVALMIDGKPCPVVRDSLSAVVGQITISDQLTGLGLVAVSVSYNLLRSGELRRVQPFKNRAAPLEQSCLIARRNGCRHAGGTGPGMRFVEARQSTV